MSSPSTPAGPPVEPPAEPPADSSSLPHRNEEPPRPEDAAISLSNRSLGRDVHIYDSRDASAAIGGLILTHGVTNSNLYAMVELFILFEGEFTLRKEDGILLERDGNPLQHGKYFVHSDQPFNLNNEAPLLRTPSMGTGVRIQAFRQAVRLRDRRCVLTKENAAAAYLDDWTSFDAAHVFPLAYESVWKENNFGRWIEIVPKTGGTINSVQNGLLLRSDIHNLFDMYSVSINPDDNYKIVCFRPNEKGIAGTYLDQRTLEDPARPVDQLLRWHFRQAVLVNMKGAGEPVLEHDFPPGSDIVGSILSGPKAAARMEFELFNRLALDFEEL